QPELHPEDERRQDERDPRQPVANQATPGVSAPLAASPSTRGSDDWASVTLAPGGFGAASVTAGTLVHAEPAADPRPVPAVGTAPGVATAATAGATAWERFAEELITWLKTLASAAVYATLIVTFVCQVARVEGQSMEPTLENQDRL